MSKLKQIHLTFIHAAILYVGLRSIFVEYLNYQHGTHRIRHSSRIGGPPTRQTGEFQKDLIDLVLALYRNAAARESIGIIIPQDYWVVSAAIFAARNCQRIVIGSPG